MPRENRTVAILFADIAKSTHLCELLGDKSAQRAIGQCIKALAEVTDHHNGEVIKTIGDEIICTFPTALDAIAAGKDMHEALQDITLDAQPKMTPPNICVGIQNSDVFWS